MDNITATVDINTLQEKANEFATKGALKAIEDFYTGYNSPYKKGIIENLSSKSVDNFSFALPDILALINEHLTIEIDAIANTAVAKSFVPLVAQFLTRQEKTADFSDILKQFIETAGYDEKDPDNFNSICEKDKTHGWYNVELSDLKRSYSFTLYENYESKKTDHIKYQLLSLPYTDKTDRSVMKISIEGASLELPFTRDILKDSFVSKLAGYVISNTVITMDTTYFNEDMFPHECHC